MDADALFSTVKAELSAQLAKPLAPGLYLVATPIGNLGDITLRALAVLAACDALYCEDARHSLKLLNRYGLRPRLKTYHEHNAQSVRPDVLELLAAGKSVALISDAGTPLVSDPGFKLVRAALDQGHKAISIPGPSATLTALAASGLPTDCFTFAGFLPVKAGQRLARLQELKDLPGTLVLFEAPGRTAETLAAMVEVFGAGRPAAVARELTKLHEAILSLPLGELAALVAEGEQRGEYVLLVGPAEKSSGQATDSDIQWALGADREGSLRERVDRVAEALGTKRKRVYNLAIEQKNRSS